MAKSEYTTRLITRIRPVTSRRLRLAAAIGGQHIGQLIDGVLDEHLPSDEELAELITKGNGSNVSTN